MPWKHSWSNLVIRVHINYSENFCNIGISSSEIEEYTLFCNKDRIKAVSLESCYPQCIENFSLLKDSQQISSWHTAASKWRRTQERRIIPELWQKRTTCTTSPSHYGVVTSTHQSWCVCSWGHCFWVPWPASHPYPPGIWISTCNNPHLLVGSPTLLPGNTPSPPSPRQHWVQMGLGRTEKHARKKQHKHRKVNIR